LALDDVKPGDKLIANNGRYCRIIEVERVTPTLVIAEGVKYSKKTGYESGPRSTWAGCHVSPATESIVAELEEETRRQLLINNIVCDKQTLRTFSTEKLEKLYGILVTDIKPQCRH